MMCCTTSIVWSRSVLSLCCTEHGPSCDAILSGHITIVAMSRSGSTLHCSGMHICRRFSNARACLGNT
jgi:hypothetical protein